MGIEISNINNSPHAPTPEEFLVRNPNDARRIALDLAPFASSIFGLDMYREMIEHNPAAAVTSIAEKIASTKDDYIMHIIEVYAYATENARGMEKIRWNHWLERMRGDDYGMILVGPVKWLQNDQEMIHDDRRFVA